MQVASYYAGVGVKVDKTAFANVKRYFESLETRLNAFSKKSSAVKVNVKLQLDPKTLSVSFQKQFNTISKGLSLKINHFAINNAALSRMLNESLSSRSGRARIRINAILSPASLQNMRNQVMSALGTITIKPNARFNVSQVGGGGGFGSGGGNKVPKNQSMMINATGGAMGSLAAFTRYGAASIPFVMGAYGLNALRGGVEQQTLLDVASQGLFKNARMPTGETRDVYEDSEKWLTNYTERLGLRRTQLAPVYQGFMAASMPAMGYESSQEVFESISQLGVVRGATGESMQRALTAVQQMAGKGQVMAEELKQQLAEAQGFGEMQSIFAEAWQIKQGTNKVGAEAIAELLKAMENGKVISSELLPIVGRIAKATSASAVEGASNTSLAERARAGNATDRFTAAFSKAGGDSGFSVLWRTIAQETDAAARSAEVLGRWFEIAATAASTVMLLPRELVSYMKGQGGDMNVFTKMFGVDTGTQVVAVFESITESIKTMFGAVKVGTDQLTESLSGNNVMGNIIKTLTNTFGVLFSLIGSLWSLAQGDTQKAKSHFIRSGNHSYLFLDSLDKTVAGSTNYLLETFNLGEKEDNDRVRAYANSPAFIPFRTDEQLLEDYRKWDSQNKPLSLPSVISRQDISNNALNTSNILPMNLPNVTASNAGKAFGVNNTNVNINGEIKITAQNGTEAAQEITTQVRGLLDQAIRQQYLNVYPSVAPSGAR